MDAGGSRIEAVSSVILLLLKPAPAQGQARVAKIGPHYRPDPPGSAFRAVNGYRMSSAASRHMADLGWV